MAVFYVDGQSIGNEQRTQPRAARIAFVAQSTDTGLPDSRNSKVFFKDIGDKTNNEAEYHALLAALSYVSRNLAGKGSDVKNTRICSDSNVIVNQVNGDWKVEQPRLIRLREKPSKTILALTLLGWFGVRRGRN